MAVYSAASPVDERRAGERREQVEGQEAGPADGQLELRAEHPQGEHVEADVPDLDVRERAGHQLPVRAVADAGEPDAVARVGSADRLGGHGVEPPLTSEHAAPDREQRQPVDQGLLRRR